MAESIREQIIRDIASILSEISVLNGYNSDVGQNVILSENVGDAFDLPAIAVDGGEETVTIERYKYEKIEMVVTITAAALYPDDPSRPGITDEMKAKAEAMLADIRLAMAVPVLLAERVIRSESMTGAEADPDQGGIAAAATAEYIVTYRTLLNDPYNQ